MNLTVLAIVIAYLIVITAIIFWSGKKVKNYHDFALGGGAMPWYVITGTMFASTVGGATMIGYVGSFKTVGLQWAIVPFVGNLIGAIAAGLFFAERLKNLNQYTLADMFKIRFGNKARVIAAVLNCLGEFAVVASMMASFGTMANGYLGIDYRVAMVLAIFIFYFTATKGGFKGVAWTDTIQSVIIFVTVAIVAVISYNRLQAEGGFAALPPHLLNPFAENMPWLTIGGNAVSLLLMFFVNQSLLIQRINACRDPKEAKKAAVANAFLCGVFMIVGIGIIGLAANFSTGPDVTGNNVITAVLATMNPVLGAFYAAAILAAVLTTANSLLLSCSMTFVRDVIPASKPLTEEQQLKYSKAFIFIAAVMAFVVVQFLSGVLAWILITYTILACLCVPLYGGLLSKKTTPMSGVLALALGGGSAIVWEVLKMFKMLPANVAAVHSIFLGVAFGALGLVLGLASSQKSTPAQMYVVDCFIANKSYDEADVPNN